MKDQVTRKRLGQLHPQFIPEAEGFINDVETLTGKVWRIVQGFRSFAEQDRIYALGRTTPGHIATYSPGGASYHNYGLAIDIAPFHDDLIELDWGFDYKQLRPLAVKYGLQMGLDFPHPDYDHFENKFGINWREMLHRYTTKDFIPNTQFIRL